MIGKSTFTYSCVRQAEVAVSAESQLQELLEFGSVCQSANIGVQICLCSQTTTTVFCDMQFMRRPSHVTRGNSA